MNADIHGLVGAYAVDAVNERSAPFELHLAQCADCRAEVASCALRPAAVADERNRPTVRHA